MAEMDAVICRLQAGEFDDGREWASLFVTVEMDDDMDTGGRMEIVGLNIGKLACKHEVVRKIKDRFGGELRTTDFPMKARLVTGTRQSKDLGLMTTVKDVRDIEPVFASAPDKSSAGPKAKIAAE